MGWLLLLLHSSPDVPVATVMLATIAGLYGYYGLVGKPGGVLRQLLVAIPAGILFGSSAYLYDARIHFVFSNTIRELLTIPTAVLPASWPAALYFGMLGFSLGLTPTLRSIMLVAKGEARSTASLVMTNVWAILVQSLTFTLAFQIALVKLHVFPTFRPPLSVVVVITVIFVVLRRLYRLSRYTLLQRLRGELELVSQQSAEDALSWQWVWKWVSMLLAVLIGGLIFALPIAVVGLSFWVYFVSILGWGLLTYFAVLLGAYLALLAIQYGADHLPRTGLQIISLVLFVIAAGLQLYSALAG
jgi:hypothetical protein